VAVSDLAPQANFTISSLRIEGVPIIFNDTSTSYDPLTSWNWSFGDGGYSQERNASHTYAYNGSFSVTLKVWDWDGSMSSKMTNLRVLDSGPNASFTYSPAQPNEGQTIYFYDTSVHVDNLTAWFWSFGGLGTSADQNPTKIFPSGQFNVTLTVWDVDMNQSSYWTIINVADLPLTAAFENSTAVEGSLASFTEASVSPFDPIVYYNWTFGDGAMANGSQVWHAYNRSGNFVVSLHITDSDGTTASTSRTISVVDVDPVANFTHEPEVQQEGAVMQFNDTSFTFNYIVSWAWNFGDSGVSNLRDPVHTYQENGTYNVTLTVMEFDGSSASHYTLVSIADTSPVIISLRTSDGGSTYAEDQAVTFEVLAVRGSDQFDVNHPYQWDLNFSGSFTAMPLDSLVNHTIHQFSKSGTYRVSVRVWDVDSYREATQLQVLVIEITDPRPTAAFNFHNVSSGTIQLDASSSSDNPSDVDGLLFSWNFDDGSGYTAWNATRIFNHHFTLDGEYSVNLRVKDDSNQISESTRTILIDRIAPEVVLSGESTNFNVGEAIQVSVTVHDPNGVSSVTLHYSINNASEQTLSMTRSGAEGVYVAQIAPQNHDCNIAYWVTATDSSSNVRTTGQLVITVSSVPITTEYVLLWLSAILIIVAVLLLFMRNAMVPVDEVFIIYNDGRLMAHQTRRLKPGMDDEILSSMLVAIQGFVKDSFKDESSTHLQRLDFGEKKILVERGDSFYLAVVLHSHRAGNVPQRMQAVIEDIHREYGLALKEWDGDLEKVRGVKDQTERLFKSPIPLALPGLNRQKATEQQECPVCGSAVLSTTRICPSCGAELSLSTMDDLEVVAKDLEKAKDERK
jgi:PKD repeat protein